MTNRILWIIVGVIALIGGFVALANPFPATLAATLIAGWMFLFVGILELVAAFRIPGTGPKIWAVILGALALYLGITVLGHPLKGSIALTTAIAILFLGGGLARIILSFTLEDRSFFWLTMISGIASLLLGIVIFMNWPLSAASSLGILLGVELIFDGVGALALGFSRDTQET
ncbi:HdeD family acid-resistance protein [Tropicimonas sp.]|uniref:HdeD family acid-resistance protein n=1 Tax=Tropicimonas sp. TaxID=2067044 RepID=UPI003A87FB68